MALLSIADHHTRMIQGQSPDGSQRALGILVGHQDEEETHIVLAADSLETQEAGKSGFNWTITKEVAQLSALGGRGVVVSHVISHAARLSSRVRRHRGVPYIRSFGLVRRL